MTRLRKMMLEELERRNYSEATTRCYICTVEEFSRRFKCSPDGLGPEHIREYQAELFKKRKLSARLNPRMPAAIPLATGSLNKSFATISPARLLSYRINCSPRYAFGNLPRWPSRTTSPLSSSMWFSHRECQREAAQKAVLGKFWLDCLNE